jgi:hypothetical protein
VINPYGFPQPDFGSPLSPQSGAIPSVLQTASQPVKGTGMFGGGGNNIGMAISAALNGYLAAGGNRAGIEGLQALHQQRLYQQQQAAEDARAEANRAATLQNEMKLLDYKQILDPTNGMGEFEKALYASGVQPGTPEWAQAMKTRANNMLDPPVMTPQGMMLRSQVVGAGQPAPQGVTFTPIDGGPTPPASGNFLENNPGALRVPGSMQFQRFSSPQQGIAAQEALLGRYMGRGLNNVQSIVERYAPRESAGGDNTDAQVNNYIGYVSKRLGVQPGQQITPAMLSLLGQAMREFETGKRAY